MIIIMRDKFTKVFHNKIATVGTCLITGILLEIQYYSIIFCFVFIFIVFLTFKFWKKKIVFVL